MPSIFKNIVVGTSLTQGSDGIVRTGVAIARATGARLSLIHAFMPPVYSSELGDGGWYEAETALLHKRMEEQAIRTGLAGLPGFSSDWLQALAESAPRQIVDVARELKADLIVIGAEEHGALHRIFLGSTAEGVVRLASCPVLVVRSETSFPPSRVEIPVDLSPISAKAFQKGLSLLAAMGAALDQAEALFVLNPYEVGGSLHFSTEQVERFAGEELRRFVETHSAGHPPHLARVRVGYPREMILEIVKERQVDLVILGTHGRGGFERFVIGSVAAEVLHRSECNLLIVPSDIVVREEEVVVPETDLIYVCDEAVVAAGSL